jgi:hypothetical protein
LAYHSVDRLKIHRCGEYESRKIGSPIEVLWRQWLNIRDVGAKRDVQNQVSQFWLFQKK